MTAWQNTKVVFWGEDEEIRIISPLSSSHTQEQGSGARSRRVHGGGKNSGWRSVMRGVQRRVMCSGARRSAICMPSGRRRRSQHPPGNNRPRGQQRGKIKKTWAPLKGKEPLKHCPSCFTCMCFTAICAASFSVITCPP